MNEDEFDALSKLMTAPMVLPGPRAVPTHVDGSCGIGAVKLIADRVDMHGDTENWVSAPSESPLRSWSR